MNSDNKSSRRRLPETKEVSKEDLEKQYLDKLAEWRQSLTSLPDYMRQSFEPIHHAYLKAPNFDSAPSVGSNLTTWNWVFWSVGSYPEVWDSLLYLLLLPHLMPAPEVIAEMIENPDIDFTEEDVPFIATAFGENLRACMSAARKDFFQSLHKRLNTVIQEVADELVVKTLRDVGPQLYPIARIDLRQVVETQEKFFQRLRKDRINAPTPGRPTKATDIVRAERGQFKKKVTDAMLRILDEPEKINQQRVAKILGIGNWRNKRDRTLYNRLKALNLKWPELVIKAKQSHKRKRTKN